MKLLSAVFVCMCSFGIAQTRTVGLLQSSPDTYDGYTLMAPMMCPANDCPTYLIDNCGEIVHTWPTTQAVGLTANLLPNGDLLRAYVKPHPIINAGGRGGGVQLWDFDGNLLWDYTIADSISSQHHEITPMPNGNILALVWSYHDSLECVAKGRIPTDVTINGIWSDKIIELRPIFPDSAEVIWQWDNWDHLVQNADAGLPSFGEPDQHPELFNINYLGWSSKGADWLHTNAIDYNPHLDQIAMSSRYFHEVYIIDHSTTTAEAASHSGGNSGKGGDLLYRWGNPEAYGKDIFDNRTLFAQHNVHWIKDGLQDAGKLMIFNNGTARIPFEFSSVDIVDPAPDVNGNYQLNAGGTYGPAAAEWTYIAPNPADFHAQYISGAERLANGHTIINDGTHGTVFEIDENKNVIWKYIVPSTNAGILSQGDALPSNPVDGTGNWLFRAPKYGTDYPAFAGKIFSPQGPMELNPLTPLCTFVSVAEVAGKSSGVKAYPNPTQDKLTVQFATESVKNSIKMKNVLGAAMSVNISPLSSGEVEVNMSELPSGIYLLEWTDENKTMNQLKVIKSN